MKFRGLQDNLRRTLQEKIAAGELTGLRLAEKTGFRQAHISNFLNRRRSISIEGMDRVLSVQKLSVLDLLDPDEVNQRASIAPPSDDEFENVALVDAAMAATQPLVMSMHTLEVHKFRRSFLRRMRADARGKRRDWERFVAMRAQADSMSMHPRIAPGAIVLIDRHYNSLGFYRKGDLNIYAAHVGGKSMFRYVELAGPNLVLRPHNQTYAVDIVPMEKGKHVHDYIVGRVCYVGMET